MTTTKLKNKLKRKVLRAALTAVLLSQTNPVKGNDIFIGTRGSTKWQVDVRVGYSQKTDAKGNTTVTTTQNDVLKYWNTIGKKEDYEWGMWAFANIPALKSLDTGVSKNSGFGDFTLGAGPRFTLDLKKKSSLHGLTYGGAVLPTGETETGKLSLSGERTDVFAGGFFTYFSDAQRKFEADLALQYTFAGKNSKSFEGKNTLSGGLIFGGRAFENKRLELRLAGGINGTLRSRDYIAGPRGVVRITPKLKDGKKPAHFELLGDYDYFSKNISKGFSVLGQFRYNF